MTEMHSSKFFDYSSISTDLLDLALACKEDRFLEASRLWNQATKKITELGEFLPKEASSNYNKLLSTALEIAKGVNGISDCLFSSLIEHELICEFYETVKYINDTDDYYGNWHIISSKSGAPTLYHEGDGSFIHSTVNPVFEAKTLAKQLFNPESEAFHIFLSGLGYLPLGIYNLSSGAVDIYVYEYDRHMKELQDKYGVLNKIPKSDFHYIYNENATALFETFLLNISDRNPYSQVNYYLSPRLLSYMPADISGIAKDFQSNITTHFAFRDSCLINFYANIRNVKQFLPQKFISKKWIVVAAGPSLDSVLEYIKNKHDTYKIIAASTVYKKLLNYGIHPDYVCVLDSQKRTFGHIEGVSDFNSTLIVSCDAALDFGKSWDGQKYLFPTGNLPEIIKYLNERNLSIVYTSGTVITLAIEAAIYMGAEYIEFAGLDLAYPFNKSHAEGTMDYKSVSTDNMLKAESVTGSTVLTTDVFLSYLSQIESIIEAHPDITFKNLSDSGLKIKGC